MKEPLVMLPDMMCDARVFAPQVAALSADLIVTVAPVTGAERIESIVNGLLGKLPSRFALAGLGMGGIVAMDILRKASDRVTRLCLINTSPLPETPAVAATREPLIVGAQAGRLDEVMRETVPPESLAPGPARVELLNLISRMGSDLGPGVYVRQARALQRRRDQQRVLRRCDVPTLILCGEHDALTPVKRHEFMADLMPQAELKIIAGAGHIPTLEQPEAVNALLRGWMDEPLKLR